MKYLLLVSILMFATAACGQSPTAQPSVSVDSTKLCKDKKPPVQILFRESYKIKVVAGTSSATARVADYVEFKTMELIYTDEDIPREAFPKDTSIYAVVTRRKTRHFPLVRGKLEIALEPLLTWDNKRIEMGIKRHPKVDTSETGLTGNELKSRNKHISKPCQTTPIIKTTDTTQEPIPNCVAGRGDAAVSAVVTAVAGGAGTAVSLVAKDDDTKFIAATSFFQVAKDLGNLLNGTDVQIGKDEIFDLVLLKGASVCMIPKKEGNGDDKTKSKPTGN